MEIKEIEINKDILESITRHLKDWISLIMCWPGLNFSTCNYSRIHQEKTFKPW
jgi:deoxyadenosine/deoxycytidine kinase